MKRYANFPRRQNFIEELNKIGFNYWDLPSGPKQEPYWQEGVCYVLSESEIDQIQAATQSLHDMSIEMVGQMVQSGDYPDYFALDQHSIPLIEQSWQRQDPSFYGRFDLVMNALSQGGHEIKMLEYNGDTPVSILECAVAQWHYVEQLKQLPAEFHAVHPDLNFPESLRIQYNLIDEMLIETWQKHFSPKTLIHFAASAGFRHEDWGNLIYILDTASRAGMDVKEIQMGDIGLTDTQRFIDLEDYEINHIFKLYPWEWMTQEGFAAHLEHCPTRWMEPAWKMLLSNKAMLVRLWEMFPKHPLLLPAYSEQQFQHVADGEWCKKAIHGREGANIHRVRKQQGHILSDALAQGSHFVKEYLPWGAMYQQWYEIQKHDGFHPIIGSWIIGDQACGMSIREDRNLVTGDDAFFASHIFVPEDEEKMYAGLF